MLSDHGEGRMWKQKHDAIAEKLDRLLGRVTAMALDISKLVASENRLIGDVDTLLTLAANTKAALDKASADLATAIAASDPTAIAAAQAAIDAAAATLDAEAAKVEATQTPPVGGGGSPAPTGVTA
jgi:peptidoglycan hydrolase CwlO-like protein